MHGGGEKAQGSAAMPANSRFLGCRRVRSGARNDNESGTLERRKVSDVEDARVADRSELRWHLQWEAEVRADHRLTLRR
jgi:hypothetical protein